MSNRDSTVGGFGVTPEDRDRWERMHQQQARKQPGGLKAFVAGVAEGYQVVSQQAMQAKMRAAYQVQAEDQFEAETAKAQAAKDARPMKLSDRVKANAARRDADAAQSEQSQPSL